MISQMMKRAIRRTGRPSVRRGISMGELAQIDGAPHDCVEDWHPRCMLITSVNDADTSIGALPAETTRAHLGKHGRPMVYYSDQHIVFRVNQWDRERNSRERRGRWISSSSTLARHRRRDGWNGRIESWSPILGGSR